jgi:deoxycytidine triphosphate deaminase
MLLHPLGENTLTKLTNVQDGDVQPNAVDIRLGHLLKVEDRQPFVLSADNDKKHKSTSRVVPDKDGYYMLPAGTYEFTGEGEAGFVITRSTLNRNGVFLTSGLYDSGYSGVMAGVMHVTVGYVKIQMGARIGQYLNFKSESIGSYDGSYGDGKSHDEKYVA